MGFFGDFVGLEDNFDLCGVEVGFEQFLELQNRFRISACRLHGLISGTRLKHSPVVRD